MSRFTDNIAAWSADQPGPPPIFVDSLLMDLRVVNAPPDEQIRAIANWLADQEPVPLLREDLERRGLGRLLKPRMTA